MTVERLIVEHSLGEQATRNYLEDSGYRPLTERGRKVQLGRPVVFVWEDRLREKYPSVGASLFVLRDAREISTTSQGNAHISVTDEVEKFAVLPDGTWKSLGTSRAKSDSYTTATRYLYDLPA